MASKQQVGHTTRTGRIVLGVSGFMTQKMVTIHIQKQFGLLTPCIARVNKMELRTASTSDQLLKWLKKEMLSFLERYQESGF